MAALAGESELPFLCINVAASKERLAWQRGRAQVWLDGDPRGGGRPGERGLRRGGAALRAAVGLRRLRRAAAMFERRHLLAGGCTARTSGGGPPRTPSCCRGWRRFAAARRREPWALVGEDDTVRHRLPRPPVRLGRPPPRAGLWRLPARPRRAQGASASRSTRRMGSRRRRPAGARAASSTPGPPHGAGPEGHVRRPGHVPRDAPRGQGHRRRDRARARTRPWHPFDQVIPYLAAASGPAPRIFLAADPGLVWELAKQHPDQAGAASNREALDGKAAPPRLVEPAAKPTKRKFKIGAKKA